MLDRTQKQIMQSWKRTEPRVVSVICATYNHEAYIGEAIDSILMQETDFPFEIIIHDDASTDDTACIIKEYHLRYPDIIRPIFQDENQYSKGGFKPAIYAASYSTAEYIALCEGDDYWISNHKLQQQIIAMQKYPEVDFSFHSAYRLRDGRRYDKPSWDYGYDQVLYPDSILNCVGSFAPTASYVVRREVIDSLPGWIIDIAPVGDFFIEMYGARRGGALYINKPMSIYRENLENSWSTIMAIESTTRQQHRVKMLESLQLLQNDFAEYAESFKKKKAVSLGGISNYYLLSGSDDLFKQYIEKSVSQYAYYSVKQNIAYKLRSAPALLRGINAVSYWGIRIIKALFPG